MESTALTAIFLPLALMIIMLGVGLSLRPVHFQQILTNPKPVFTGLSLQILALPAIAWGIAVALQLPPALAVGLMIIAACPGGSTSNLITHLAKGDTALSITLTALSSLIVIISLPIVVNLSTGYFLEAEQSVSLPIPRTILQILLITVIPVSIGMFLRNRFERLADKAEKPVKILSVLFLALIIAGIVLKEKDNLLAHLIEVGTATLLLNILCMAAGYLSAKIMQLNEGQKRSITIEVGIQNGTMGVMVATTLLNSSAMAIPVAIYSLLMFVTGAGLVIWGNMTKRTLSRQ